MTGLTTAAALSVSNDLTQKSTRSAGGLVGQALDGARLHHPLAFHGRTHAEPVGADALEMTSARHEGHGLAGARELGPEVASRPAGPHHDDAHDLACGRAAQAKSSGESSMGLPWGVRSAA